jgi:hypothetical protein
MLFVCQNRFGLAEYLVQEKANLGLDLSVVHF